MLNRDRCEVFVQGFVRLPFLGRHWAYSPAGCNFPGTGARLAAYYPVSKGEDDGRPLASDGPS